MYINVAKWNLILILLTQECIQPTVSYSQQLFMLRDMFSNEI